MPTPPYQKDDSVITPNGDHARVVRVAGNFLTLRYVNPLPGAEPEFDLHARLVSKYVPGLLRPEPIRIDRQGKRVRAAIFSPPR